jgi:ketosteroid isomerase-like protein
MRMLKILFCCLLLLGSQSAVRALPPTPRQAIAQVLTAQTAAWNRGDIPGFMAGYWHSDSLVFIGKGGPTYGWQTTLNNYRRRYPTPAEMGQLTFSELRTTSLGTDAAQVVGRWHLARPGVAAGDLGGYFLLIFRRLGGQWVIVADHTS